jgi:hypothetical protein
MIKDMMLGIGIGLSLALHIVNIILIFKLRSKIKEARNDGV